MPRLARFAVLTALVSLPACALDLQGIAPDETLGGPDSSTMQDSTAEVTVEDTSMPIDSTVPDTFVPDTFVPDTFVPDTFVPDTFVPDTFVPDTFVPDTFVPDTFVPDTFVPDTFVPDTFVPDTFVPDTFVPDTFVPDTAVADTFVPDTATTVPCTEPNSGVYNGHCYFLVNTGSTWTAARDACVAASTTGHPAHLATLTTAGEWSFVNGLGTTIGYGRWFGLSATAASSTKSSFAWVTGETGSADKWAPTHPNSSGPCVVQHSPSFSPASTWEDVACTSVYVYLCERE